MDRIYKTSLTCSLYPGTNCLCGINKSAVNNTIKQTKAKTEEHARDANANVLCVSENFKYMYIDFYVFFCSMLDYTLL